MKKIVITFGIIAGLVSGSMFYIMHQDDPSNFDFENGMLYGYISMLIAFSTIFFAVKQYRDKYNGGVIKFGKAFLIGLYITLIASVVYIVAWEIYYNNFATDFTDVYMEHVKTKMAADGKTAEMIETELADQIEMMETYKNSMPLRMVMTLVEIFPVGLLVSLISALVFGVFLKKKPKEAIA